MSVASSPLTSTIMERARMFASAAVVVTAYFAYFVVVHAYFAGDTRTCAPSRSVELAPRATTLGETVARGLPIFIWILTATCLAVAGLIGANEAPARLIHAQVGLAATGFVAPFVAVAGFVAVERPRSATKSENMIDLNLQLDASIWIVFIGLAFGLGCVLSATVSILYGVYVLAKASPKRRGEFLRRAASRALRQQIEVGGLAGKAL